MCVCMSGKADKNIAERGDDKPLLLLGVTRTGQPSTDKYDVCKIWFGVGGCDYIPAYSMLV